MKSGRVRMRYVIAYDIADDGSRTKLSNFLLDYGDRMQKSVFEADLNAKEVQEILAEVSKHIDKHDSLRLYPLYQGCQKGIKTLGRVYAGLECDLRIV